ncbi:MAG: spermidine synthase [Pseudomonadota bacterium]
MRRAFATFALAAATFLAGGCSPSAVADSGRIVYRQKSMYRDILVTENAEHRCLSFARRHGLQTCVYRESPDLLAVPYTRGVFAGLLANPRARRVLVIGLGGGVIPRAMRRIDPALRIDVVELDPAVVDVAKRYFGYREDPRLRTHIGDGRVFVRRSARRGERYDLIVIDAYERVYVPEHLMTREFVGEVRSLLAPGGVVASNTFAVGPLAPYEAATYQSVFGETRVVDMTLGNRIILAGRDGLPSPEAMRARGERMQDRLFRVGIVAAELEARPQAEATGYRPLTDQYSPANLLFDGE